MRSSRLRNHHLEKNVLAPDELFVQDMIVLVANYGTLGYVSS